MKVAIVFECIESPVIVDFEALPKEDSFIDLSTEKSNGNAIAAWSTFDNGVDRSLTETEVDAILQLPKLIINRVDSILCNGTFFPCIRVTNYE